MMWIKLIQINESQLGGRFKYQADDEMYQELYTNLFSLSNVIYRKK